jgi:large subunit ribosomal protein L10
MPNLVNQMLTTEYGREFSAADGMVLVSMAGLTVAESHQLRGSMAAKGVKLRMVRNKLAKRVLAERGLAFPDETLTGNIAIAYGGAEAAIHAAKLLTTPEAKKAGKLKLRAGVLDGQVLNEVDACALADVPDQDTLRAMIVGCIQGPSRGLAALLAAIPSGMARVIQAHADQAPDGEQASSTAAEPGG